MKTSIVTSTFFAEKYILQFLKELEGALGSFDKNETEIIITDDGSKDNTLKYLKQNIKKYFKNYKIFSSKKNIGHHQALMNGIKKSKGDIIVTIDSDLEQNPKDLILKSMKLISNKNTDCIIGIQQARVSNFLDNFFGWLYFTILNNFSYKKIKKNETSFRIFKKNIKKKIVDDFYNNVLSIFIFSFAFPDLTKKYVYFKKSKKKKTNYSYSKKIEYFLISIFRFTHLFGFSFVISVFSLIFLNLENFNNLNFEVKNYLKFIFSFATIFLISLYAYIFILGVKKSRANEYRLYLSNKKGEF